MASRRSRERANARPWEQEPDEPQRGLAGYRVCIGLRGLRIFPLLHGFYADMEMT